MHLLPPPTPNGEQRRAYDTLSFQLQEGKGETVHGPLERWERTPVGGRHFSGGGVGGAAGGGLRRGCERGASPAPGASLKPRWLLPPPSVPGATLRPHRFSLPTPAPPTAPVPSHCVREPGTAAPTTGGGQREREGGGGSAGEASALPLLAPPLAPLPLPCSPPPSPPPQLHPFSRCATSFSLHLQKESCHSELTSQPV